MNNGNWYIYRKRDDGNWELNSERGYTLDIACIICRELWLSTGMNYCINTKN